MSKLKLNPLSIIVFQISITTVIGLDLSTTTPPLTTTTANLPPLLTAKELEKECGKEYGLRNPDIQHSTGELTNTVQEAWAVAIMYQNYENSQSLLCSGSIVSENHVLTAAHCKDQADRLLKGDLSKLTLVMGANDPTDEKTHKRRGVAKHKVKKFITHYGYDGSAYKDIAIIETKDRIQFRKNIWPLCLPKVASNNADEFVGDLLRVVSYGPKSTSQAQEHAAQLWKLTSGNKLLNKNGRKGKWVHGNTTWNIPDEKKEGYIEDQISGYVLGLNVDSGKVEFDKIRQPVDDRQIWKRSEDDPAGWFEFQNKHARQVLSAHIVYLDRVFLKDPVREVLLRDLSLKGWRQATCESKYRVTPDNTDYFAIQAAIPDGFTLDLFCAGSKSFGSTCPGDSGGPILAIDEFKNRRTFIQGIVRGSATPCDSTRYPPFFVRVSNYHVLKWIHEIIHPGEVEILPPKMSDIGCNSTNDIESLFGMIRSEDYPQNYPSNSSCTYHIKTKVNRKIKLITDKLEINDDKCRDDYVSIKSGNQTYCPYCVRICGNENYGRYTTPFNGDLSKRTEFSIEKNIVINHHEVTLTFTSDTRYEAAGFQIRYEVLDGDPIHCEWGDFIPVIECSKSCGGGERFFTRSKKKTAQFGGLECTGSHWKNERCNEQPCPA